MQSRCGGPKRVSTWLCLVFLAAAGCQAERAPEQRRDTPQSPAEVESARRGRIYPNLVLIYDPGNKENELWVRLEIKLDRLGEAGTARVLNLLQQTTPESLRALEELVSPHMGDGGQEPRRAFREMVHCAFLDNIRQLKDEPSSNCPDDPKEW